METIDILVAEDDAVLREVYTKKFSLSGFQIRAVENGQKALEAITAKVPAILILDLNMPVLDGFSVMEKFPKDKRSFPIIVLTNFGDDKTRQRATSLGADDLFVKSEMTIKSLLEMVQNLLRAKKYWQK
ncbi:MAG: response regulator [Candidatus Peribacteraceae bacterium]|nr:response regulator [Candidatus Peribacteraceae bacterium]